MQLREVGFHLINSLKSFSVGGLRPPEPWTRWGACAAPKPPAKKSGGILFKYSVAVYGDPG